MAFNIEKLIASAQRAVEVRDEWPLGAHVELDVHGQITRGRVFDVEGEWIWWLDERGGRHASPKKYLRRIK